ncbi:MAG: biosynthetic-type acetolactate synthase large subunit, partial [Eggerthellaceae bacterium]|nr:biosynthetic-type acetolactate synthase large subunit [Eggerthellaceae bacterium]
VTGTDSFQDSDIFGITMPIVKHSYLVNAAADLPRIIHEAFHIARTGRPGPVLIDIPSDVAAEELDFDYPETVNIPGYKPTVKGHARQLKQAVALISQAKRPVLYVGGGVISAGASVQVRALAEMFGIPVVHTLMGIGALPTDHLLNIGMVGMHGCAAARRTINGADVVIACGARFSDRVIGDADTFAADAKIIHIDIDPAEIGKIRTADVPIVGDLKAVLGDLLNALDRSEAKPDTTDWVAQTAEWRKETPYAVIATREGDGVSPAAVLELINRKLDPEHSIITTEVGQHQMWAAQFLRRTEPRSFITSGGLGTMGFGFPAAIGAQYGRPDCTVVCIAGDGSFVMNAQEMATAAVYGVPVKVIIFNNRCLGMVHQWQKAFNQGRYSQTELEACPDFMKLAHAYGWSARRISSNGALVAGIEALFEAKGPFLLEVMVSRDVEVLPFSVGGKDVAEDEDEAASHPRLEDTKALVDNLWEREHNRELWD